MSSNVDGVSAIPSRPAIGLPSKRLLISGGVVLLLAAAAAYTVQYLQTGRYLETTNDAYVGGDVTDIAPNVSGIIAAVDVTDNQQVHKGDLLVQIDPGSFAAALAHARAAVTGERANLANLAAQATLQNDMIAQAQAGLEAANAALTLAAQNRARYQHLAATQAGTEQDAQTAISNFTQAQAARDKAGAALAAAEAQLTVIGTEQQTAQAALAGAQADARTAAINLAYCSIRAPINGVVGNRSAHTGGYAQAGAQLISIVPATGLWVDANFKEDQLARMQPGQPVTVTADVAPETKITGHVVSLAPASGAVFSILPAENATGNFTKIVQRVPVRITLEGSAGTLGLLRPGLSVTASVDTK